MSEKINKESNSEEVIDKDSNVQEVETKKVKKTKRLRTKIVLLISLIVLIVGYIYFRGNYIEIKGIGENYLSIFKTDFIYTAITFIINFIFLFLSFYFTKL